MSALDSLFGFFSEGIAGSMEGAADREALAFNRKRLFESAAQQDLMASDELARGALEAGRIRQKGSDVAAQQAVAFAASGIDASTGTPAALGDSSRIFAELDVATAKNNARRAAMGHQAASKEDHREADRLAMEANQRAHARETRTLLSWGKGVASVASGGLNGGGL